MTFWGVCCEVALIFYKSTLDRWITSGGCGSVKRTQCFEKESPSLKAADLKKLPHKVIVKLVA